MSFNLLAVTTLALLARSACSSATKSSNSADQSGVYYPPYCHHTDPIEPVPLVQNAKLLQVTILHRHGDRGRYSSSSA